MCLCSHLVLSEELFTLEDLLCVCLLTQSHYLFNNNSYMHCHENNINTCKSAEE